jgi:hypothetical protein
VAELRDFLRDYTEDFVVSLFEALESQSLLFFFLNLPLLFSSMSQAAPTNCPRDPLPETKVSSTRKRKRIPCGAEGEDLILTKMETVRLKTLSNAEGIPLPAALVTSLSALQI